MKIIVGISECRISKSSEDIIVTHGLGSCIGLVLYDPILKFGAMLHYMLPTAGMKIKDLNFNPFMFGDTGISTLLRQFVKMGSNLRQVKIIVAGGASINSADREDFFAIGKKNQIIARKILWREKLMITSEHTGGSISRSMYLDMSDGSVWFMSKGQRFDLLRGI